MLSASSTYRSSFSPAPPAPPAPPPYSRYAKNSARRARRAEWEKFFGRKIYPFSLDLNSLPTLRNTITGPDAEAVNQLQSFLTACLMADYGVHGLLKEPLVVEIKFKLLFVLLCDKRYYHNRQNNPWKEHFANHYDKTALELGLPAEIARNMLLSYDWVDFAENMDRFQNYRSYLRGIPDVAEKLFFDRELVIDKVVKSEELRLALKDRLKLIQTFWFDRLEGPQKTGYELADWGKHREKVLSDRSWSGSSGRSGGFMRHWRAYKVRFLPKVVLMYELYRDQRRRARAFARRPPPGTVKEHWPRGESTVEGRRRRHTL